MRRILPYLFVLYIINYLDRVNISFAALSMTAELNFTAEVFGFGTGIFFIGYFLLEIPGTLLVEVWSARKWIARIMITWGMVAVMMGFMNSASQFYWLRLVLGAAEAGFFPGIIVYLTHWFRYQDRAKVVALFMTAVPLANFVGAPISGLLLGVNWFGLAGWRWLFIVEGAPAIVLGIATIFYLTDWPREAKWLTEEERGWIAGELAKEIELKASGHSIKILKAFRHREVILLTLAYFFIVTGLYGFNVWLPTIVKSLSGLPNLTVTLISALPYFVGFVALLFVGWSSDRTGERRLHSAVPMFIAGAGLLLSAISSSNVPLALAMFCIAAAGLYSFFPPFWALPTSFLTGSAAAASIGLINSFGNLGGFVGPYVVGYVNKSTNSFLGGMLYLALSSAVGGVLILTLRHTRGTASDTAAQRRKDQTGEV